MLSPLLAWGLMTRGLGLVFSISHLSIAVQILGLCGAKGIQPYSSLLKQIKHDFPSPLSRLAHFPSLFWLVGSSDVALLFVPLFGALCGVAALVGAFDTRWAFVGCWTAMRSLDLPIGLLYPWDSLLFEAGGLAMLLPHAPPLSLSSLSAASLSLSSAPHPWVAAAFRWLLCRLMLGFGKKKFVGTSASHSCYIKNFLVAQPIPSPLGWLGYRMPLPLFQAAIVVMFVVECIVPLFLLAAGTLRGVAAILIAHLMIGIQAGGNFGHFNILTSILCLGCLDTTSSVFDAPPPLQDGYAEVALRAALAFHTALSFVFFLFDSWCTNAFAYWPQLAIARKGWVRALLRACRLLADHRLLHAYGVFPPSSNPPMRMAPVLEGSSDGKEWRRYEWKYLPCAPTSKPAFVAPHHPRLDHSLFYVSFGTGADNFLSTVNSARPYGFSKDSMLHRIGHALLGGASPSVRRLFGNDPFPEHDGPPLMVRVRLMGYEPLPLSASTEGRRWSEVFLDVHLPPMSLQGSVGLGGSSAAPQPSSSPASGASRRRRSTSPARGGGGGGGGGGGVAATAAASSASAAIPPIPPPLSPGSRDPLLFHPDLMPIWRRRSPKLRKIVDAPLDQWGAPAYQIAMMCVDELGAAQDDPAHSASALVGHFWSVFVPHVQQSLSSATSPIPVVAGGGGGSGGVAAPASSTAVQMHACELILGGLTMRMMVALEALHLEQKLPLLGGAAPTYFHLVLLAHALILRGPRAASGLLLTPSEALKKADASALEACEVGPPTLLRDGLAFYGLLWTDQLVFHARKYHVQYHMMRKYNEAAELAPKHPCLIPGFLFLMRDIGDFGELKRHVTKTQQFPLWTPPAAYGDWERVGSVKSTALTGFVEKRVGPCSVGDGFVGSGLI